MRLLQRFFLLLFLGAAFGTLLNASAVYKYSYLPKKAYDNQIFPVTILETGSEKGTVPRFAFDARSPVQPIFPNPQIVRNGDDSFYTFYFKAQNSDIVLPRLTITDKNSTVELEERKVPVVPLKTRDDFCGVLASDMKIRTFQASTYDEKNNLLTLSIEAFDANVENMHLRQAIEDGVENINRKYAKVTAEFFVVIPATMKTLKFTYFNTIKNQYEYLEVPIEITDSTVSTQSELNPKDDSFEKLKKNTFIVLTVFFFLLFLWKRDFFYLVLAVVALITLVTFYTPKKKICVKQGASLNILPTDISQISTKTDQKLTTPILGEREKYYKIEYKHGIIGWVRDEDICKD